MSRLVVALSILAVCLGAPRLGAQEKSAPVPASLSALQQAGSGERWYGIYARALNVGALRLETEEPEEGGFRVCTEVVYPDLSPNKRQEEVFEVDAGGAMRSYHGVREDLLAEVSFLYEPSASGGVRWRIERRAKPAAEEGSSVPVVEEGTMESVPPGSIPFFSLPLVLERLDWSERAVHDLSILPPIGIGEILSLSVSPLGAEKAQHRGRPVDALRVRASVAGTEESYDFLLAGGQVVEITGSKEPLRFVLGEPEESRANLDLTESEEELAVKTSSIEFLVAVVLADEAALDRLVDFEEMERRHHDELQAERPEQDFRSTFLERIRGQSEGMDEPQVRTRLEAVIPAFRVALEDRAATLFGPGETPVLRFVRHEDAWRVVWWNQLAGLVR